MQDSLSGAFGPVHPGASGDAISRAVAVVLALMADLDAFAHDSHAFFTIGKPCAANGVPPCPLEEVLEHARGARVEAA
jgi:hypothetical protein